MGKDYLFLAEETIIHDGYVCRGIFVAFSLDMDSVAGDFLAGRRMNHRRKSKKTLCVIVISVD